MTDRLLIGTRKGLFILHRQPQGWTLPTPAFLGEPVSAVLFDVRSDRLYCALNLGHFGPKLHRSDDFGASWNECLVPSYPVQNSAADTEQPAKLVQIWCLESGGPDEPGVLWAGTIPGGLFRSTDAGDSWELIRSLWDKPERVHWVGGGFDQPGIHSVCVNPNDSRHLSVGVSCGGVWVSTDSGTSWALQASGMRAEYMPPGLQFDPTIQDPHRVVQCRAAPECLWAQHHNGIFRSTDGARSWTEITHAQPSAFGFAVAVHPADPATAWFVPAVKDQYRVPVDAKLVVTRTRDGGESFEVLREGLPDTPAYDLIYRHCMEVDASGQRLAMGSTTGNLWISENQGDSWECTSTHLPPIYCVRFA